MPTRKAPTLSGATYDNATSPPVAGRVPGRRGDARSHGGPAGPVVPAAPEHATTARVARVLGWVVYVRGGLALHARGALQRGPIGFQFGYLHLQCAEIGNVGRALCSGRWVTWT